MSQWSQEVLDAYESAKTAQSRAYAKYSKFHVGCCFVRDNGEHVLGCNVENVSNGATRCAEQGAICQSIARFGNAKSKFLVVISPSDPPAAPCGICLQVLSEFFPPDFPIILGTPDKLYKQFTLKDFLPLAFTADQMLSATEKKT